ncbi:MAG TPA: ABC transporter permease [Gemmataceae bacterium]|nr:ABC transporter permease [Gemmataceae bacterium]
MSRPPVTPAAPALDEAVEAGQRRLSPEMVPVVGVLVCTGLLMIAIWIVSPESALLAQVEGILVSAIFLAVAAFGQGLTILLGGIDLSIGVVMGLGGMMISGLTNGSNDALVWAVPATLVCCAGIGLVNGVGVALGSIPPFIMTLASATSFFGVGLGLTAGAAQAPVAPALEALMSGRWLGVPWAILLLLAFAVVAIAFQNNSVVGRKLYAVGSSPGASRVLGLPVGALTIAVYATSALCAGTAGLLLAGYSSAATLNMGDPFLLPSIAAVVIGGARVTGGRGIYLGTFAGALFLSTLETIITVLSLSQGLRDLIQGAIIVTALIAQRSRSDANSG